MTTTDYDKYIQEVLDDKGNKIFYHRPEFYTEHLGLNIAKCRGGPLVRLPGKKLEPGEEPQFEDIGKKVGLGTPGGKQFTVPGKGVLVSALYQIHKGTYVNPKIGKFDIGALITNKHIGVLDFDTHPLAKDMLEAVIKDIGHNAAITISSEDPNGDTANKLKAGTFRLIFEMCDEVNALIKILTSQKSGHYAEGYNGLFPESAPGVDFRGAANIENDGTNCSHDKKTVHIAPAWTLCTTESTGKTHKLLDNPVVTKLHKLSEMPETFKLFKEQIEKEIDMENAKKRGQGKDSAQT